MAQQPMTILVIDDEPISNLITRKMLHRHNPDHQLVEYTSPEDALLQMNPDIADVIFLDLNMPTMTGWEFLSTHNTRQIPVILLTSSINHKDLEQSKTYPQVIHYQAKPLTIAAVDEILNKV